MARRNTGEQPASAVTMHEQRPRARHSSAKKKAQDSRKVQKYATQGLRQRQALEEVNDFSPLDPESEEDDCDQWRCTMSRQQQIHFTSTYSKTPVAPLPSTVMDPQLLTGGFEENSHVDIPSKYVQQSRFEQRFATVPHHMDGQVEHHTPTPFRGVPQSLMANSSLSLIESPVMQQPFQLTALGAGKRLAPPLTEVNGLQVVQKVKLGDGGSRGRVRCADFDGLYSSIIHLARVATGQGEAWAAACRANGVKIDYDEDTYKLVLITLRGSNLRSELKTVMRPLVVTEFRFIDEKTPEAIKSNAALAESLLANRKNFTYKDQKEAKGAFEADVIQKGMIKWCYEKKNSLGIKFPTYFVDTNTGGASFGIIVAILTAIEACIMEWTTGMRIETKFYKEQYAMVFDSYLQLLGRFTKFLKVARRHANVPNEPVANTFMQHFTVDEFTVAAAEWDTCNGSDSDNDMM
ncbi:hypothetical protein DFH29DRAFT_878746 [Suillus ampliporus]|nr:hypothetical protein DFH29DRAFT_878746 [Suillus ampliporus]